MSEVVNVLHIDTEVKDTPVKSLKKELREATQLASQLAMEGKDSTKEYTELLKRMAKIRDTMDDVKQQAKGFHPDNFEKVATVANGIAGGMATAAGAMQLFGLNAESAEAATAKLQSVMAISQGIAQLKESVEMFKLLGTSIKSSTAFKVIDNGVTKTAAAVQKLFAGSVNTTATSFKVLKGAIAATGIGLLVIALGEVISLFNQMGDAAEEAGERYEKSMNSIRRITELDVLDQRKRIAELKKNGASEDAIMKEKVNGINSQIELLKSARDRDKENAAKYDEEIYKIVKEGETEVAEYKAEQAIKARELAKQNYEKNAAAAKAARDKEIEEAKQRKEALLSIENELQRERELNKTSGLDRELLELDFWWQDKQAQILKNGGNLNNLREVFLQREQVIRDKYANEASEKQKELEEKRKALIKQEMDATLQEADTLRKLDIITEQQYLEYKLQIAKDYNQDTRLAEKDLADFKKQLREKEVADEKLIHDTKLDMAFGFANSMIAIGQLLIGDQEKNNKKARVLAGAQIAVNAAMAMANAIPTAVGTMRNLTAAGAPPPIPQLAAASVYAGVVTQIANQIKAAKSQLGLGGSAPSAGGSGGGFNVPSASRLQDEGKTGGGGTEYVNVLVVDHYERVARRSRRNAGIGVVE